ncbi:MAG: VWA domain-containing protein [Candidatus Aenigmatarchaeota archaeon]
MCIYGKRKAVSLTLGILVITVALVSVFMISNANAHDLGIEVFTINSWDVETGNLDVLVTLSWTIRESGFEIRYANAPLGSSFCNSNDDDLWTEWLPMPIGSPLNIQWNLLEGESGERTVCMEARHNEFGIHDYQSRSDSIIYDSLLSGEIINFEINNGNFETWELDVSLEVERNTYLPDYVIRYGEFIGDGSCDNVQSFDWSPSEPLTSRVTISDWTLMEGPSGYRTVCALMFHITDLERVVQEVSDKIYYNAPIESFVINDDDVKTHSLDVELDLIWNEVSDIGYFVRFANDDTGFIEHCDFGVEMYSDPIPFDGTVENYPWTLASGGDETKIVCAQIGYLSGESFSIERVAVDDILYDEFVTNPELPQSCGTDMVLVMDSSGSIDALELDQMRNAFQIFPQHFMPATPTEIALVDFDTHVEVIQVFTDNKNTIQNAINSPSITSGGSTNWEAALIEAHNLFPHRDNPNLIIFASDGNPNVCYDCPGDAFQQALDLAIDAANDIKRDGIRIITIGIGNQLTPWNLEAISSPDAFYTSDFDTLADDLATLALELCGGVDTIITAPPEGEWQGNDFFVYVEDHSLLDRPLADLSCEYMVTSGAAVTVPWSSRVCNDTIELTVGNTPGFNCYTQGFETCGIRTRMTDTMRDNVDEDSRYFSIDSMEPSFTDFSSDNCAYVDVNVCWVREGDHTYHNIEHTDTGTLPDKQYLSFTLDGCQPGNCGLPWDAYEVRSYDIVHLSGGGTDGFFDVETPDFVNDAYMNIEGAWCLSGDCSGPIARQEFLVTAGNVDEDFLIWVDVYDRAGNNIGFTSTNSWYKLDNSPPEISINIAGTETYSRDVTIDLTAIDRRSGLKECRIGYDDGTWDPWTTNCNIEEFPVQLTAGLGTKTMFFEAVDNVGHTSQVSDDIELIPLPTDLSIIIEINDGDVYTNDTNIVLNLERSSDNIVDYRLWNDTETPIPWPGIGIVGLSWTVPATLTPGIDGVRTVWAEIRNTTGGTALDSDGITLDMTPPTCSVDPLPQFIPDESFEVKWNANDVLSGMAATGALFNQSSSWIQIGTFCSQISHGIDGGTYSCDFPVGETRSFRCWARDVAGNYYESIETSTTTVISGTGPIAYFTALPDWMNDLKNAWTGDVDSGDYKFTLEWDVQPGPGTFTCFDVEWSKDGTNYFPIVYNAAGDDTTCTNIKSLEFGSGNYPENLAEGTNYQFRVRGHNDIPITGEWSLEHTTLDVSGPILNVKNVLSSVNTTSNATDMISGIASHTIDWDTGTSGGLVNCPVTGPGISSICNNYLASNRVKLFVKAVDYGGLETTETFSIGSMVDFLLQELRLVLGSKHNLKVVARNIDPVQTDITLNLYGNYPLELVKFLNVSSHEDFAITNNGKTATIYNIDKNKEAVFFVQVSSSDHDEYGKYLKINATSAEGTEGSDEILIYVSYPSLFPGLNDIAVLVLIIIAVGIFYRKNRKE